MAEAQEDLTRRAYYQALETECPDCDGSGAQTFKDAVFRCETCDGKGSLPTEFGRDVLRFLTKFRCEAAE